MLLTKTSKKTSTQLLRCPVLNTMRYEVLTIFTTVEKHMPKRHLILHHLKSANKPPKADSCTACLLTHQAGLFCSLHVSQLILLMLLKITEYKSFSQEARTYNYAVHMHIIQMTQK